MKKFIYCFIYLYVYIFIRTYMRQKLKKKENRIWILYICIRVLLIWPKKNFFSFFAWDRLSKDS